MNQIHKILAHVGIGAILGGITYYAAYESLSSASIILGYGGGFIPTVTTLTVMLVYFGCLASYSYLESFAQGIINAVTTDSEEEDEEE